MLGSVGTHLLLNFEYAEMKIESVSMAESTSPWTNSFVQRETQTARLCVQKSSDSRSFSTEFMMCSCSSRLSKGRREEACSHDTMSLGKHRSTSPSPGALGRPWAARVPGVCQTQVQNVKHTPVYNLPAAFTWGQLECGWGRGL